MMALGGKRKRTAPSNELHSIKIFQSNCLRHCEARFKQRRVRQESELLTTLTTLSIACYQSAPTHATPIADELRREIGKRARVLCARADLITGSSLRRLTKQAAFRGARAALQFTLIGQLYPALHQLYQQRRNQLAATFPPLPAQSEHILGPSLRLERRASARQRERESYIGSN